MYHLYIHKFINLAVGCVPENKTHIKFPLYIDPYEISSCEKINEINNYVKNIELNDLMIKKYCCLINRHDYGHTRTTIYNKLSELGFIICPSVLFNNYPNEDFEKIGRENFQKEFKNDIISLKKGTDSQAKLVFDSMAIQLRGSGFAKEQIDLIIKALQEESGKTNFKFDFANIDLSTDKGMLNFDKNFA